ncbi:hypothetical protein HE1_00554 [Holospora elegans E1]|uniref:SPOR domain-containing protein n=1 Tax=Holospora elegans E1 TaxID=1427503 RepID=A0A023DXQ6_9PROT|nr:hypothetical protein HE1_00554 [Holospora elegans E1]
MSVAHLSFDEATWVRVQSNTFHWICSGIKKVQNSGHKPFMILLGPFLNQSQAQKVINFFKKNHMSAVVVPLS